MNPHMWNVFYAHTDLGLFDTVNKLVIYAVLTHIYGRHAVREQWRI